MYSSCELQGATGLLDLLILLDSGYCEINLYFMSSLGKKANTPNKG